MLVHTEAVRLYLLAAVALGLSCSAGPTAFLSCFPGLAHSDSTCAYILGADLGVGPFCVRGLFPLPPPLLGVGKHLVDS